MKTFGTLMALTLATLASADTTLEYNTGMDSNTRIHFRGGQMLMSDAANDTAVLFDAAAQSMTVINHSEREYMLFGPKQLAALGNMRETILQSIEQQLAGVPAAQREQIRDMMMKTMKNRMPAAEALPEYQRTGQNKTVNGHSCEVVINRNNPDSETFCVTRFSELGMQAADYSAYAEFMKLAEKMTAQLGNKGMNFSVLGDFVPVEYRNAQAQGTLVGVQHETLSDAVFAVPADYTQQRIELPNF